MTSNSGPGPRGVVLTAAAVVVGSVVMLFDPIFEGLAIAMMSGAVAATALTLVAVPLLYYEFFKNEPAPVCESDNTGSGEEQ